MTQVAHSIPEAERQLLQRRLALFAIAIAAIGLLAAVAQAALATSEYLKGLGFATLVAGIVVAVVAAAVGAGSTWSLLALRIAETLGLIVGAVVLVVMGREIADPGLISDAAVATGARGQRALLTDLAEGYVQLGLTTAFTYLFLVRAALVPSPPLRTFLLTALIGYPALVVMATGVLPFQEGWLDASSLSEVVGVSKAVNLGIWWLVSTTACTLVSGVMYGLRREIRAAMQVAQYRLEHKLGEGGMGVVYRAQHALLKRPTAIKLLLPEKAGEANVVRFEREVRLTARLTHPSTVTVFDYGHTPDGVFYYAMELLEGATLDEIVRLAGPLPPGRVIHVLSAVVGALEEAHGVGLIHRDVKPGNIILCERGGRADVPKRVDFGLVKEIGPSADPTLTREGAITGTPLYMSPEALTSPGDVDARSDIYAVGAVGYFLLTGTHVFRGRTLVEVFGHHLHTPPEPPVSRLGKPCPADLEALLLACLSKAPDERPQSASELRHRLDSCEDSERWTASDARRWWEAHGSDLTRRDADGSGDSAPASLVVDVKRSLAELTTRSGPVR